MVKSSFDLYRLIFVFGQFSQRSTLFEFTADLRNSRHTIFYRDFTLKVAIVVKPLVLKESKHNIDFLANL